MQRRQLVVGQVESREHVEQRTGYAIRSRTIERLTFITSSLGRQLNSYPRMNWRLLTQDAA